MGEKAITYRILYCYSIVDCWNYCLYLLKMKEKPPIPVSLYQSQQQQNLGCWLLGAFPLWLPLISKFWSLDISEIRQPSKVIFNISSIEFTLISFFADCLLSKGELLPHLGR